jgi:hypothetical protein
MQNFSSHFEHHDRGIRRVLGKGSSSNGVWRAGARKKGSTLMQRISPSHLLLLHVRGWCGWRVAMNREISSGTSDDALLHNEPEEIDGSVTQPADIAVKHDQSPGRKGGL